MAFSGHLLPKERMDSFVQAAEDTGAEIFWMNGQDTLPNLPPDTQFDVFLWAVDGVQDKLRQKIIESWLSSASLRLAMVQNTQDGEKALEDGADDFIQVHELNNAYFNKALRAWKERKKDKLKIDRLNNKLSRILETIRDAVIILDEKGVIRSWSSGATDIFGFNYAEVRGKYPIELTLNLNDPLHLYLASLWSLPSQKRQVDAIVLPEGTVWLDCQMNQVLDSWGSHGGWIIFIRDVTYSRIARERRLESEKRYRELVESSNELIWSVDLKGNITFINQASERILGYGMDELLGKNFFDLAKPNQRKAIKKAFEKVIYGNSTYYFETSYTRKDGRPIFISISGRPLKDGNGEIIGTTGIASDVTQKKLAEIALQGSEATLRALLETSNHIYILLDKNFKVLAFNRLAKEVLASAWGGFREGEDFMTFIPDDLIGYYVRNIEYSLSGNASQPDRFIDFSGENKDWYEVSFSPVQTEEGKIVGVCIAALNVTARKAFEDALVSSEANMRATLENTTQALILMDKDCNIVAMNQVAADFGDSMMKGRLEIGHCLFNFIPDERLSVFREKFAYALTGKQHRNEQRQADKKGRIRWLEYFYNPVRTGNGDVIGVCLGATDVTEYRLAEEKVREKNAELHKKNEELDRFVYSTSHELRAPLTSVLGLVRLIQMENVSDDIHTLLGMIERSVSKLNDAMLNIINYSKNTHIDLNLNPVGLQTLIPNIWNNMERMEQADEMKFLSEINENAPLYSDESRLRVVLGNILQNAVKFSDISKNEHWIKVSAEVNEKQAIISISDNGIGVEDGYHEKIFGMFYRATVVNSGSGLGLYIVKEILETMNGKIAVDSQAGEGSTFTIILPNHSTSQMEEESLL